MKIRLADFSDDIYILLEDNFRREFFKEAYRLSGGSRNLCKLLGVSRPSLESWRRGRQNSSFSPNIQYCPLRMVRKICRLGENFKSGRLSNMEHNIVSYKAHSGKLKVNNPIFPIEFNHNLGRIIGHLLGDGTAQNINGRTSKYTNTSKEMVIDFSKKLSCFGTVSRGNVYVYKYNKQGTSYTISFPKAITKILLNKLKINFDWNLSNVPNNFIKESKEFRIGLIKSFFIDEGCVKDRGIFFVSGNKKLLEGIRKICMSLEYNVLLVKESRRIYQFGLRTNSLSKFYIDINKFGKVPHESKRIKLKHAIRLTSHKWHKLKLESSILNLLGAKRRTSLELAHLLEVRSNAVSIYLAKLERNGLVRRFGKNIGKGGAVIWEISPSSSC